MKAVVLMSGGLDSCVCAGIAKKMGYDLNILFVRYGQKTEKKEEQSVKKLAEYFEADLKLLDLRFLGEIGGSALTDEIEVRKDDTGIPSTYVPFRNSIFLSLATAWAEVLGAKAIFYGANSVDFSGYPDCRPDYFKAFQNLIEKGTKRGDIKLLVPLAEMSKSQIVKKGMEMGLPLEYTWSCYFSNEKACGKCESCKLRLKGFEEAGYKDPIEYE
ncbi:MAG TPA: 7-cyano-7-deazaguanine synthase QueC [Methanomicrobia archaeon]|nr:7-cyano-7-deazaguanine synthase QueC [Methanomicrobia archaeon]